ncbi:hypothetical protein C8R45DRAFT_1115736 [Mycena sanguinolenta]|nr:hypothetical protein C8R45DRAFT_1115736 [Mycena sanguinolenta]
MIMPHVSFQQKLLRSAYKYAAKLQKWRKRDVEQSARMAEFEVEITGGLGIGDELYEQYGSDLAEDSDSSSISSISSISLVSSINSTESAHSVSIGIDIDLDLTGQENLYKTRYKAVRSHIQWLENTRVVNPNKVHKLHLVLEAYKADNEKRFQQNLRVSPSTFDKLVDLIQDNYIFLSEGSASQMPIDHQLAIALFCFGYFCNSASVESIAQWAGVSAGMVVNGTRWVMVAFLDHHDEIIR